MIYDINIGKRFSDEKFHKTRFSQYRFIFLGT